ncbi:probable glutamate--tRNA ligase, mitochondrial [Tigriopus californicus]|nr:probable glutamate--tRNA ligase, mitochondrial [Tigriopus californicus]|eukprot:TCALIF_07328-PA protein Name:"Similar to EARS2 Probable glutamate--tRNA ligase, mitochondrial (Gallus gallus)" AED:0.18 eAED:0.18 QI:0/0/0/1/1/1/2/0/506
MTLSGLWCRSMSTASSSNVVRVRFAPSPTGHLHLGGFRTALYNYLWAKSQGPEPGRFVLRIEDTDQSRLVPGAAEKIEHILEWTGLVPDESPLKGGDFGPYVQSQRLHLYSRAVEQMLASGHAYRCFCTERRLELMKKECVRLRVSHKYDRRCLELSQSEIQEKLSQGVPHTVRLKIRPFPESFSDLIYGDLSFNVFELEGDPIILKSDGFPTYHLANVVDDHWMNITHVLRGVEWQISTPKHLLLYEALGWIPPKFAHLPLIVNSDGTKMSKRQNDIQVEHYKDQGFYPEAVMNFATLFGGGYEDKEHTTDIALRKTELVSKFRLERIGTKPSRMELQRLADFNRTILKEKLSQDSSRLSLVQDLRLLLRDVAVNEGEISDDYLLRVMEWATDRIFLLKELVGDDFIYIWKPTLNVDSIEVERAVLEDTLAYFKQDPEPDKIAQALKKIAKKQGIKFPALMKSLRLILSGSKEGAPIKETIDILGIPECIQRLDLSIKKLERSRR